MAFRLSDFDAIGFDVDHTVVQYKLENLFPLVYNSLAKFLVEKKDYPKELVEHPFEKFADFCTRGLILESDKGNFVKISKDGKVVRASHGTKIMSEEEIKTNYGEEKTWEPFTDFLTHMKNRSSSFHGAAFRMFENFFDMPAMLLCARLVDIMDSEDAGKEKYRLIWPDVLSALIENFDYRSFKEDKGHFYPSIKADIEKYVHPCSDKLKKWLTKLRSDGLKLFLITNSQADFSQFVLEAAFGNDWLSYFNVAISRAGKPVNGVAGGETIKDLENGKYYAEGNSVDLERFLGKLINKEHVKILFFGDSLVSDVYPPNFFSNWETVALLEEMTAEISDLPLDQEQEEEFSSENSSDEPGFKKAKIVDERSQNTTANLLESSTWGSIFNDGQHMNTLFASLIDKYSSLVIPGLDYLTELKTDHTFVKTHDCSTRFYPRAPKITEIGTETN